MANMTPAEFRAELAPIFARYAESLLNRGIHHSNVKTALKSQCTSASNETVGPIVSQRYQEERRNRDMYS